MQRSKLRTPRIITIPWLRPQRAQSPLCEAPLQQKQLGSVVPVSAATERHIRRGAPGVQDSAKPNAPFLLAMLSIWFSSAYPSF